ncbi:hypothetical protein PMIN07_002221 [Paraphaeosphaeria minitans]
MARRRDVPDAIAPLAAPARSAPFEIWSPDEAEKSMQRHVNARYTSAEPLHVQTGA